MQNSENDNGEVKLLQQILKSLVADFYRLDKTLSAIDQSHPMFITQANLKNRIGKNILSTISLIRDPKLVDVSDDVKRAKHDISSLIKKVKEMDRERGEKTPLMARKDLDDPRSLWGPFRKQSLSFDKTRPFPPSSRAGKLKGKRRK